MAVNRELIRKLVKVTNDYDRQQSPSTFAYGTVVDGANSQHFVKIDGSEWQVPIAFGTDAQADDRVLVRVENHKATVIGNLSTPASARTASDFMRFKEDEDGSGKLYIGRLDTSGNPTDSYVVIDHDSFDIWSGGFEWASLGKEATRFYVNGQEVVSYGKDGMEVKDENGKTIAIFKKDGIEIRCKNTVSGGWTNNFRFVVNNERFEAFSRREKDSKIIDNSIGFNYEYTGVTVLVGTEKEEAGFEFDETGNLTGSYAGEPDEEGLIPIEEINFLTSKNYPEYIPMPVQFTTNEYPATCGSGTTEEGQYIYIGDKAGYYVITALVRFTETNNSINNGRRKVMITLSMDRNNMWWHTQPAGNKTGASSEVEVTWVTYLPDYAYIGVSAYQDSGYSLSARMLLKAIRV